MRKKLDPAQPQLISLHILRRIRWACGVHIEREFEGILHQMINLSLVFCVTFKDKCNLFYLKIFVPEHCILSFTLILRFRFHIKKLEFSKSRTKSKSKVPRPTVPQETQELRHLQPIAFSNHQPQPLATLFSTNLDHCQGFLSPPSNGLGVAFLSFFFRTSLFSHHAFVGTLYKT